MNKKYAHYIDDLAEVFRACCERHAAWFISGFSVVYLLITCRIASRKMLWNDELFTLYIARLADLSDLTAALSTGADQQPPSFYLLTRVILQLLGETQMAVRLPEVLGLWLMCLCLFRFVSKRLPVLYGFAAMGFPLVTIAYEYSYEARPYGLVLGFSSLALLCWQEAGESPGRRWWLIGLAVSGAAAVSSHYYAIFLVVPLGIGEIVRSFTRRRIDIPVWIALGSAMFPLALFLPFLQQARAYSSHFWAPPKWSMVPGFYYYLLFPAIGPIVATLVAASLWPAGESPRHSSTYASGQPPCHEVAAALGFVAIPAIALIMAKLVTGAFTYRYALSAVIGVSILCAIAVFRLNGGRAIMGGCFTLFIYVWFIVTAVTQLKQHTVTATQWSKTYAFMRLENDPALPIVVADLHSFMALVHYAPRDLSTRLVYLADPQASVRYLCNDTIDRGILDLKPWFHVPVEEYGPYIASHERFLLYARVQGERHWLGFFWGEPWEWNWLLNDLHNFPVRVELRDRSDDNILFLVTSDTQKRSARLGIDGASTKLGGRLEHTTPTVTHDPCQP